jgi:hypothetical protein
MASLISFPGNFSDPISDSKVYIFGGMCPNSTGDSWQSSASYTDSMLRISITASSGSQQFTADTTPRWNLPVAEAGMTMTPLTPSYSLQGNGQVNEQQAFILIGGQTSSAFTNMSRLALFSLPQETWSYILVNGDSTVLSSIQPRSGHTAVLSQDGKQVIIFGGWVGDVSTAATPPLVILSVDSLYGGAGNWTYTVPTSSGTEPSGLFGHGAIMLPGNVMMVAGGINVADGSQNSRAFLYNVTTNAWVDDYDAPTSSFQGVLSNKKKSLTAAQTAGLAVGVSIFIVAVLIGLAVFLWWKRKQRWDQEQREDELRGKQGFVSDEWGNVNEKGPASKDAYAALGIAQPAVAKKVTPSRYRPREVEVRKSVSARSPYRYERTNTQREGIQTIAEGEEEPTDGSTEPKDKGKAAAWPNSRASDMSHISSDAGSADGLLNKQAMETELNGWKTGWEEAGMEMFFGPSKPSENQGNVGDQQGRISPSKSDRTLSSLSAISAHSGGTVSTLVRSLSRGSAQLLGIGTMRSPFANAPSSNGSSSPEHPATPVVAQGAVPSQSSDIISAIPKDSDLIYRRPQRAKSTRANDQTEEIPDSPKVHAQTSLLKRWNLFPMGSGRSTSLTASSSRPKIPALTDDKADSSAVSTSAATATGLIPRRAASDASFWNKQRGAKDWGVDGEEEEEWDVERAVEARAVQLMFTVPKQTLRVVNGDADDRSVHSAHDGDDRREIVFDE